MAWRDLEQVLPLRHAQQINHFAAAVPALLVLTSAENAIYVPLQRDIDSRLKCVGDCV
jgi:hypothetical protein